MLYLHTLLAMPASRDMREIMNKLFYATVGFLLVANVSAAEDQIEYVITIPKSEEPATVISLSPQQPYQMKVVVAKDGKPDEKIANGSSVTATCIQECSGLIDIASTATTTDGVAIFKIKAKDKVGDQIISFSTPGAKAVTTKINVIKPSYTLSVKGSESGKAQDLKIDEENLVEVEVKDGNKPVADGTEVLATIKNISDQTNFYAPEMKEKTINGTAKFHIKPIKPKDGTGLTVINFRAKDAFAEATFNISRLSFYQAVVEKVISQLLGYIAILAAIGTVSMGILEALKWNDFVKGLTQSWLFRRHLVITEAHSSMATRFFPPAVTKDIAEDIIKVSYGRYDSLRKRIFYRQSAEEMIKKTQNACSEIIGNIEKGDALKQFTDIACPPIQSTLPSGASDDEKKAERTNEETRRQNNLNTYFEAVLTDMNASWKYWNQLAAILISTGLIGYGIYHFSPSEHGQKTFFLAFLGGLLAPMAKDFTNSASTIINKMKGS